MSDNYWKNKQTSNLALKYKNVRVMMLIARHAGSSFSLFLTKVQSTNGTKTLLTENQYFWLNNKIPIQYPISVSVHEQHNIAAKLENPSENQSKS